MKIAIVGGVAGGASAAARARRLDEHAEIVLIERGPDPSFANCGMPYYIGGRIDDRRHLLVAPLQRLVERYRLDVRASQTVVAIDRAGRRIAIQRAGETEPYWESYDKLILAPGAVPLRPPLPGIDLPQVQTLRSLADADRLHALAASGIGRAVVIGAGFIGLEMAENLRQRGIAVSLVELADQVLPPWDPEMAAPIADHLRDHGVELLLNDAAEKFVPQGDGVTACLRSGRELTAELAVLAVGVRPENQLAVEAGLEIGPRGGIAVNAAMQTSDPDIYAVGDAVQTADFVTGAPAQIPLAGPANRQGRIAADHIFGRPAAFRGVQGTSIVGVFDMAAALTGQSEKALRRAQIPYAKAYVHPGHHASYYPGAQTMTLKLLFEPGSGRLLGAQAVGGQGVDKRIDVLAIAIQAGMTVDDLEQAELAYAPQFGAAKDPVNMAGFVAAGMLRGDQPTIDVETLAAEPGIALVDVRSPEEHATGTIPGARNIPLERLRAAGGELDPRRPLVVFCQVGQRGYMATRILLQRGYQVRNLSGGYRTYLQHDRAAKWRGRG